MTIFNQNGHITAEGFFLLVTEKADEMQRLELSEHLSFCDRCLEQYLVEMEKITLLEIEDFFSTKEIWHSCCRSLYCNDTLDIWSILLDYNGTTI